ncbi:unnamed protein product, partial [Closterium sp. Naga37s-1]
DLVTTFSDKAAAGTLSLLVQRNATKYNLRYTLVFTGPAIAPRRIALYKRQQQQPVITIPLPPLAYTQPAPSVWHCSGAPASPPLLTAPLAALLAAASTATAGGNTASGTPASGTSGIGFSAAVVGTAAALVRYPKPGRSTLSPRRSRQCSTPQRPPGWTEQPREAPPSPSPPPMAAQVSPAAKAVAALPALPAGARSACVVGVSVGGGVAATQAAQGALVRVAG